MSSRYRWIVLDRGYCSRPLHGGMQAAWHSDVPNQACHGRRGLLLGLVLHLEHATTVWMGQLPAGGCNDLLCPQLVQQRPSQCLLHPVLLPALFRFAIFHHCLLLLTSPLHLTPGGYELEIHNIAFTLQEGRFHYLRAVKQRLTID